MKSSVFPMMAVTERWWAGHGCHPSVMAGNWSLEKRHVFLSSLRELCLLLAFTVCHTAERHGYTHFLYIFSILPITADFTLTHSTPQRGNMSSSSPHTVLKGPNIPCGNSALPLCWSICWALAFIYQPINLPSCLYALPFVSSLYLLTENLSMAYVRNQYGVFFSV